MLPLEHPDRIQIAFDDHRLVNNAGLLLPATLARRLRLPELVHNHLNLGRAHGPGEHRRQDDDPGCVCAGGRSRWTWVRGGPVSGLLGSGVTWWGTFRSLRG